MKSRPKLWTSVSVVLALLCVTANAATAADLPPQLTIGDAVLKLNGSGSRVKSFVSIYSAGLYLKQPSDQADQIIAADEMMSIRIKVTSKFVNRTKLIAALQDGLNASTGGNLQPLQEQVQQFRRCFANEVALGDVYDLIYVPQTGVVVLKNGKRQGTVEGLEFKQALFGIWLSNRPADDRLKQNLLGD